MSSKKPTKDIASFFRPFARPITAQSVPRKRSSPYEDRVNYDADTLDVKPRRKVPKTPTKSVSFKDVTPKDKLSAKKYIIASPASQASLPIRSPDSNRPHMQDSSSNQQRTLAEALSPSSKTKPENEPGETHDAPFTFADRSDHSQSVIKDGKVVAVRDSDEDSDDETESLESLADVFGRKRYTSKSNESIIGTSFEHSQSKADDEVERASILSMFSNSRSTPIIGKDKLRAIYAQERSMKKFDLSRILNDHYSDLETTEIVGKARVESDDEDVNEKELTKADKELLAEMMLNGGADADAEDVSRVLSAVERTEALAGEKKYSFFGTRGMEDLRDQTLPEEFPSEAIPYSLWVEGDEDARDRAYLSGLVAELAAEERLADSVLRWTFMQAFREQKSDLQQAYLRTIEAGTSSWTRLHVTAADVQSVFQKTGALSSMLLDDSRMESRYYLLQEKPSQDPVHLCTTLQIFNTICADMEMAALSKLSSILIRLFLDEETMSYSRVSQCAEVLIDTLLDLDNTEASIHIYNRILSDASKNIQDPVLQARMISHIPAASQRAARLRKSLADIFLFGPSILDLSTHTTSVSLNQLHKLMSTSPSFTIIGKPGATPSDYAALTALIYILDVSIGAGSHTIEALEVTESTLNSTNNNNHLNLQIPSSTIFKHKPHRSSSKQLTADPRTKSFNAALDNLANTLHTLFVSITDAGASHMRRSEAKDALQTLKYRCLYSVRIGLRKKKHVFDRTPATNKIQGLSGEEHRDRERSRIAMSRFLNSATTPHMHNTDVVSTRDGEGDIVPL